jgi:hypothetical protein
MSTKTSSTSLTSTSSYRCRSKVKIVLLPCVLLIIIFSHLDISARDHEDKTSYFIIKIKKCFEILLPQPILQCDYQHTEVFSVSIFWQQHACLSSNETTKHIKHIIKQAVSTGLDLQKNTIFWKASHNEIKDTFCM